MAYQGKVNSKIIPAADSIHPNKYLLRAHYSPALCQGFKQHLLPRIMRYSDILAELLIALTISNNMGCGGWTGSLGWADVNYYIWMDKQRGPTI